MTMPRRFRRTFPISGILVLILALGSPGASALAAAGAGAVPSSRAAIALSFAPLVKQAAPAVVNIYASRVMTGSVSPLFDDPLFRRFFGGAPGAPRRQQTSLGSGVIVGTDGLIVTNHHVIKGGQEIVVSLLDRREFQADIVVSDERTDLAVLRLRNPPGDLPVLALGDSDAVEVGDLVLAIGNPFGVGQTVTSGIVSALARTEVGITDYRFFIQTDAAINPGNSGGALLDMNGKVIGINTAIFSRSGGSQGVGFAVPASMVKAVVAGVTKGGRVVRPWFGAEGQPVTAEIAQSLGLDRPRGVLVNSVYPGGPADKGGLRVGDVVVSVGEHPVDDPEALRFRIATLAVGGSSDLSVLRGGAPYTIRVDLLPPPENPSRDQVILGGETPLSGATVANLSPAVADELGLPYGLSGVVIADLSETAAAARLGFRPGDVVRAVNGVKIEDVRGLRRVLSAPPQGAWRLVVERDGKLINVRLG